jgi:hypothetical protein
MVELPASKFVLPFEIIVRKSFTPLETAESSWKTASVDLAIILANVVLPDPGGPQKYHGKGFFLLKRFSDYAIIIYQ